MAGINLMVKILATAVEVVVVVEVTFAVVVEVAVAVEVVVAGGVEQPARTDVRVMMRTDIPGEPKTFSLEYNPPNKNYERCPIFVLWD